MLTMMDVWMGGVDQRIFGPCTAAPLEKPKRHLPIEALWVSAQYNPEDDVQGRIIKNTCTTWCNVSMEATLLKFINRE